MRGLAALAAGLSLAACATAPATPAQDSRAYADFLIGRVANARSDHAAAADRYFAALARNPGDQTLVEGALLASLASGDVERTRRAARMANGDDAPAYAYIVRAADALTSQRYAQASAELEHVQGTASEELLARMVANWARAGQGHAGDIAADLAPLATIRPYGGLFAYQQAMVLDYSGQQTEALAAYDVASRGGLWLPGGVARHADLLMRTGARDQALALLATDTNSGNPALAVMRAQIEAGQPTTLERLTPARGAASAVYGMSAIFRQEHDNSNSLASLTLALMLDPGFDGARLALAQQQSELGHIDVARRMLREVSSTSPYADSARTLEAWMVYDSGDQDGGIALARAVAESGDFRSRRTLADMYRNSSRFAEAEPIYTEIIAAQPNDWRPYFSRGAARERLGRWPEAEADFQRALQLSPEQPDVLNYLGYSWVDRGEHLQEGLAMIRRAAEIRPMSGAIIDSLGWAYFRMGDYSQAVDWLEAAVRLEPADATLNEHLGDAYWRMDRRIEARFQWQRALTFSPDNPDAIRAKVENGLPAEPAPRTVNR
ncbi:MAG: tetratricopeptide repeat protein [Alphaproteobacteria bacterium]|nr:tetratricopeptide repeat protein [Alphaproteobacteria bacterium]